MVRRIEVGGRAFALAFAVFLASPASAHAQASLITTDLQGNPLGGNAGFGPNGQCLSANDDGSSGAIDITPYFGGGLRFFTRTHTRVYINTNGNITFNGPVGTYTPTAFPVADQPMIAPFWADVDNRGTSLCGQPRFCTGACEPCHNPSENGVWWFGEAPTATTPGRMIFTWDRVGYYACNIDRRMSFQLILTAVEGACPGANDFDVEFRFNRCEWEVGDASDGAIGNNDGLCASDEALLGCVPAQSGFDAGNRVNYVALAGSRQRGIHTKLCTMSNVTPAQAGVWRFQIRSGNVICEGAGQPCTTSMQGVCSEGFMNCVGDTLACVPRLEPSEELCDNLDNDCNGMTDENPSTLCPAGQTCRSGSCVFACFELGCSDGLVCAPDGRCVEPGCETVTCEAGQRCRAGSCVSACDGVTCPLGQRCDSGGCVDVCSGIVCDDCSVCSTTGTCAIRCENPGCPGGQTCTIDGRCVETACAAVTCAAGQYCQGGVCVDACSGAVCPTGQECRMGECMRMLPPDAGVPIMPDGGPRTDAGPMGADAGRDAGVDGGRRIGRAGPGCACRTSTTAKSAPYAFVFVALLGLLAIRRRRA